MNYISKTISKQAAIVSLSAFILVTAIAGLIMDASGVPWFSVAQEFDSDTGYDDFESQDWEECCEEDYEQAVDTDAYEDGAYDTQILIFSPLTSYFVLILIFSALCLTCAIIPFDIRYKVPTVTLFGLATTITGIFLARKSAISFSFYLSQLANSGEYGSNLHFHVMVYFGALVSMICLLLGSTLIVSVKDLLFQGTKISRTVLTRAQLFLSMSLVMFLLSPLVPIAYISYDEDYEWYDDDEGDGEYLFPSQMLSVDDAISANDGYDDDDLDVLSSTYGNYAIVEDLFFALMWINLSVIMLMSMSMIPMVGKVFSSLGQLNILSVPLVIIALIFSIILYVNIPDLLGDDGTYSESRHDSIYFHVNWLPLICCIVATINWIILLIKCHIPWWKEMGKSSQNLFENFNQSPSPASYGNQTMMQGRMAPQQQFNQQQYNQQMSNQQQYNQQMYNQQQQQQQFGRQPPRF